MSRRVQIETLLSDEPRDTFLRYALAMELVAEKNIDQALVIFADLRSDQPPYVPAFFMAGQQLTKQGRIDEARAVLRDGIEQARTQGDGHAAGEMSQFLASLGKMGE
jgi:thioredoxin-like negative regulator of GroEL